MLLSAVCVIIEPINPVGVCVIQFLQNLWRESLSFYSSLKHISSTTRQRTYSCTFICININYMFLLICVWHEAKLSLFWTIVTSFPPLSVDESLAGQNPPCWGPSQAKLTVADPSEGVKPDQCAAAILTWGKNPRVTSWKDHFNALSAISVSFSRLVQAGCRPARSERSWGKDWLVQSSNSNQKRSGCQ